MNAFRLYAAKVPPLAMSALAYMALVSMDADDKPWFSLGSEVLAVMALGRAPLAETGGEKEDARARKAMEHACERALKPLFAAGAITTARHSSGHPDKPHWAKYRLWLTAPAPDNARSPRHRSDRAAPHGNRGVQTNGGQAPEDFPEDAPPHGNRGVPEVGAPRNPYPRPTESDAAPHGFRGAKEYKEYEERRENLEEYSLLSSDSVPVGAREASDDRDELTPVRTIASPLLAVVPPGDDGRCRDPKCPGRPPPSGDDGYHDTCRYLADVRARKQPEAS